MLFAVFGGFDFMFYSHGKAAWTARTVSVLWLDTHVGVHLQPFLINYMFKLLQLTWNTIVNMDILE